MEPIDFRYIYELFLELCQKHEVKELDNPDVSEGFFEDLEAMEFVYTDNLYNGWKDHAKELLDKGVLAEEIDL